MHFFYVTKHLPPQIFTIKNKFRELEDLELNNFVLKNRLKLTDGSEKLLTARKLLDNAKKLNEQDNIIEARLILGEVY